MFTILLHSSKTMRQVDEKSQNIQQPALLERANELARYLRALTPTQIKTMMKLSDSMAERTHALIHSWKDASSFTQPAIDAFLGDIYSGLQVQTLSDADRRYANECLFILSGQYGVLRALDVVQPYRLEMGYKFPAIPGLIAIKDGMTLYRFWGDTIAHTLPVGRIILNLSAVEYTKAVLPYLPAAKVITPKFLTVSPKTGEPTFVTVHAKIARGAFARWVIVNRIESLALLEQFNELGYRYSDELSTEYEPVFIAETFEGIGLSVRLSGLPVSAINSFSS